MRRRLFAWAALASTLLFMLALASFSPRPLAVRTWSRPGKAWFLAFGSGGVHWVSQEADQPADGWWTADVGTLWHVAVRSGDEIKAEMMMWPSLPDRGGTGFHKFTQQRARLMFDTANETTATCNLILSGVGVPFWAVAVLTGMLPVSWLLRHARRRQLRGRIAQGLCPQCGYDLRASPDRCPECGVVPVTRK